MMLEARVGVSRSVWSASGLPALSSGAWAKSGSKLPHSKRSARGATIRGAGNLFRNSHWIAAPGLTGKMGKYPVKRCRQLLDLINGVEPGNLRTFGSLLEHVVNFKQVIQLGFHPGKPSEGPRPLL